MGKKIPPGITKLANGKYRARYRDGLGSEPTRHFHNLDAAIEWLNAGKSTVRAGTHVDYRASKVTFEQYAEEWRDAQAHSTQTRYGVRRTLIRHVYPKIGSKVIGTIRPTHLQAWATNLPLAPSSARVAVDLVSRIFKSAIKDRVIAGHNPCADITLKRGTSKRIWIPSPHEVDAVHQALPARYRGIEELVIGTGMRQGEVMGVEVDQIDFLRSKEIDVRQQLITAVGEPLHLALPKGNKTRTIPVAQETLDALAQHMAQHPPVTVEIEDRTDPRRAITRTARFVFTNEMGGPLARNVWSGRWSPAARAAKWPERTGLHALRHFYASLLIRGGAPPNVVAERLGHSSTQLTWDTYIHLWPDASDQTRKIMQRALRANARRRSAS